MNLSIAPFLSLGLLFGPPTEASAPAEPVAEKATPETATDSEAASASETAVASDSQSASATGASPTEAAPKTTETAVAENVQPPANADPDAPLPTPGPPPDGVAAVGNEHGSAAPLPPATAPVDAATIAPGPWRGVGWIGIQLTLGGALGGDTPARSRVVSFGGSGEVGLRLGNTFGLAVGLASSPHDRSRREILDPATGDTIQTVGIGQLTNIDAVLRMYAPFDGRLQPFGEVGGGLAVVEPPDPEDPVFVGGQLRVGGGLSAWIARTVTLDLGLLYRGVFLDGSSGHHLRGAAGLGFHW